MPEPAALIDNGPIVFYRTSDLTVIGLRPANVDQPTGETLAEGTRFLSKRDACGRIAVRVNPTTHRSLAEAQRFLGRSFMPSTEAEGALLRRFQQLPS
jgi:hypothetical protein